MADSHIVYTNIASHPSFQKLKDSLKKWALRGLVSNEFTSRSGIFKIGSGHFADIIDCQVVDANRKPVFEVNGDMRLIGKCEAKQVLMDLATKDKVIMYDPVSHIVYILNFLEMVPYGLSADIISKSLLKENKTFKHDTFWEHFFEHWGQHTLDYLTASEATATKKAQKLFNEKKIKKIEDYVTVTESMKKLRDLINSFNSKKINP